MPLYDYSCNSCGTTFDSLQSRPPPDTLPCECGEPSERRFPMPARTPTKWSGYGLGYVVKASGPKTERQPGAFSTEAMADGVSHKRWKAGRKKARAERIRTWCKENT